MLFKFVLGVLSIFYFVVFVWAWVVIYCKYPKVGLGRITTKALLWPTWIKG